MEIKKILVATRSSLLAFQQTTQTVELLQKYNPELEFKIVTYKTQGDNDLVRSLTSFPHTGVFVKELEAALISKKADIAIHSLKDVPSYIPYELSICSFPKREIPLDIFITRGKKNIRQMPLNFICGTGSPRRRLQLNKLRDDICFKEIRGNIDTRLKKLENGEYNAIVLAAAGLKRAGYNLKIGRLFTKEECLPAVGQGTIGIQCRKEDSEIINAIRKINDEKTEIEAVVERKCMEIIEGGCKFPMAIYANIVSKKIHLSIVIGNEQNNKTLSQENVFYLENNYLKEIEQFTQTVKKECKKRGII